MKPLRLLPKTIAVTSQSHIPILHIRDRPRASPQPCSFDTRLTKSLSHRFSTLTTLRKQNEHTEKAKELSKKGLEDQHKNDDEFNSQINNAIGEQKELQARTPWHREGADIPPVGRNRVAGAMTKGNTSIIALSPSRSIN
jgi:hypothetical protein